MHVHRQAGSPRSRVIAAAVLLNALLLAPAVSLAEGRAAAKQDTPTVQSALQKVGEARLKFLLWSVYDSRLYTPSGEYENGERPLRLEVEYLINVKADALVKRTKTEWESMGRSHPRQQAWLEQLKEIWVDIEADDVLSLELDRDGRSTFRHNGEILGYIDDAAFGQQFVDIWLSPDSSRPDVRLALLGKDS